MRVKAYCWSCLWLLSQVMFLDFFDSDILVVILHLACFVCSLAIHSLGTATQSSGAKWHLDQVD
jgi:hypothetical protein